jgi:hypothetical protein
LLKEDELGELVEAWNPSKSINNPHPPPIVKE